MKLTNAGLKKLLEKPGRHGDGDGLYFRTLGLGRAYWGYRYRTGGKEREMSLGPYPELSLIEARAKHAAVSKAVVVDKADPLADRVAAKVAVVKVPAFGQCADAYLQSHEAAWGNAKHRKQWAMTLTKYAAPIRDMPVDQVDAKAIRKVIEPMWNTIPRTADRLRGRIEAVLSSAQVGGHIDEDKPNPARWKDGSTRCSQAGEGQTARAPCRDALCRAARLHGAAQHDARRSGEGARLYDPDRREIGRGPECDVGRDRLRGCDVDRPGLAHEDGQAACGAAIR